MELLGLFVIASMPVLKVLLITALGFFLALDRFSILGEIARVHSNKLVFFVFNPALVGSNLAKTITLKSFLTLWFMPVNILITFVIGSALGWLLVKLTRSPRHLKGLIIGSCSAGNLGSLPIIIVPALCDEKGSPFGAVGMCRTYGLAYASFSMALGNVCMWSYTYYIIRVSSIETQEKLSQGSSGLLNDQDFNEETRLDLSEPLLLPSTNCAFRASGNEILVSSPNSMMKIPLSRRIAQWLIKFAERTNLGAFLSPATIAAIVGFMVGMIPPLRNLLIGRNAPLHVIQDSVYMIGEASVPTQTLIIGANLLRGLKGSSMQLRIVMGIMAVRYIILPLLGIAIVKGAIHFGLVPVDPLFLFVLLLQYALPPAMNIGTMTQLFGAGQSECSVIMLWTYASASIVLAFWSTVYLWLVAS
uniref:Auxin efflux carrier family protein n=2 Tax=Opuntia streptacantha TaxID=393608 RepID=A0A7C9ECW8_OPUST